MEEDGQKIYKRLLGLPTSEEDEDWIDDLNSGQIHSIRRLPKYLRIKVERGEDVII